MAITPTQTQIEGLMADGDPAEPVIMLNLLRFKDRADGIDEGISGREAYERYAQATAPFLARVGGRLLLAVDAKQMVIGPERARMGHGADGRISLTAEVPRDGLGRGLPAHP